MRCSAPPGRLGILQRRNYLRRRAYAIAASTSSSFTTFAPINSFSPLLQAISDLASRCSLHDSFAVYSSLRLLSPPSILFVGPISSLLSCSAFLGALPQGRQLHAHLFSLGFHGDPSLCPRLVSLYSVCGALEDARSVLENSVSERCLSWNILISGYLRSGLPELALSAYEAMTVRGIEPDCFTYPSILKACGEMKDLSAGRKVHERVAAATDDGILVWNLYICNALVSMYAKCADVPSARKLFDEMPQRDAVSWNSIISAYASIGDWDEAFQLFGRVRMEEKEPNVVIWNTIAGGYLKRGSSLEALRLISLLKRHNSPLDSVTAVVALNACSRLGVARWGKEVHGLALRHLFHETETVRNSLISMYLNCCSPSSAESLFRSAAENQLVSWNCMISGYAAHNQMEETSELFREMVRRVELRPNHVTIVAILSLFGRLADLRRGRELHGHITKQPRARSVWNSLIDMYCKSGRVQDAHKVFDIMSDDRDEVSYTAMIAGYGMRGDCKVALELFEEMTTSGRMKLDGVAMVAVLSACSHGGLVREAEEIFEGMVSCHGIVPKLEHYSCLVDLYGRAGQLEKAEKVIKAMPMEPTAAMWAALLAACQSWRNTVMGEKAADGLLKAKTDNPGHYVLAANMYASAGRWEELARVRTMMRDLGLRKVPGRAWLSLEDGVHAFVVEDRDNGYADEIYACLVRLADHMRDAGYVSHGNLSLSCSDV